MPSTGFGGGSDGMRHPSRGHGDFAPRTDVEIDLLKYLRWKFNRHVSYERILSGPGYMNVYEFLHSKAYYVETPELKAKLTAPCVFAVCTVPGMVAANVPPDGPWP